MTPWIKYGISLARMGAEAQTVIGLRTLGMMGVLPAAPGEAARMVSEKQQAAMEAGAAWWAAALRGAPPHVQASAALRPFGRRTRANSGRLSKAAWR